MKPLIVADTGPLIALAKLEQLVLLPALFSTAYIPEMVFKEATQKCDREDAQRIMEFVPEHCHLLKDIHNSFSQTLQTQLDAGEIQAISHARQLQCGVLMDEKRGRKVAMHHQVKVIGVIGLLLQAKQKQLIPNVKTPLQQLLTLEYRLSQSLVNEALRLAKEI